MGNTLKISIQPEWDQLESVRVQAHTFLEDNGLMANLIHSLVMVVSELMENSIKYGNFSSPDNRVEVSLGFYKNSIMVEVSNPVNEDSMSDLEELDRMIQWIRGYQNPFEAYIERLKEISKKPLHDKASGLGIVRIAYEGGVTLDFFVSEEGLLTVSAIRKI